MKLPPWTMVALAGAGIVVLLAQRSCESQSALKQQITALEHDRDSLVTLGRGLDTVYVHRTDTLRLTRRITDSILITDTVIRATVVKQLIQAERLACDAVIATCEEQKANLNLQIVKLNKQIVAEKKRRPSLLSKVGWIAGGVLVGRALRF